MSRASESESFPAVNLMPDRERLRTGRRPVVRTRFWIGLAASVLILVAAMAIQLIPTLVVPR
jgi:hypothetical protein